MGTSRKPSDTGRILAASKLSPKIPLVTLAMGEIGFPSRVLSTAMGAIFTYAAPAHVQGTASGQVNARQLRSLYRIDKFTKAAKIFARDGGSRAALRIAHGAQPGLSVASGWTRCMCRCWSTPNQLRDFFQFADELPLSGFSVTIPHKRRIMRYLDQVDPLAKRIGAVNTVVRKAGKWRGSNTDAEAVSGRSGKLISLQKATVLIVGNGGAARGAACALADAGAKVAITGRNPDRVRALARLVGGEAYVP